jgi:hypothetical protein
MTQTHLALPTSLPDGVGSVKQFLVQQGEEGTFVFNAVKAHAYLASTGQGNITIPEQLKQATFTVKLASSVETSYYSSCQAQTEGIKQCSGGTVFSVFEIPSPVIEGNNLNELRTFLLSLPKLPNDLRHILQQFDVKSGTVPIPVPTNVNAQSVKVQGVSGLELSDSNLDMLMWQTQSTVYVIGMSSGNQAQLLNTANSFR